MGLLITDTENVKKSSTEAVIKLIHFTVFESGALIQTSSAASRCHGCRVASYLHLRV